MQHAKLKEFMERVDTLGADFIHHINGADTHVETVLLGIAKFLRWDRDQQTDPAVITCLDSAIDSLHHAAIDYYVSLK
jgi:hypothetical protein